MKFLKMFVLMMPLLWLAGCSSTPDKGMGEGDVAVEDLSAKASGADGEGAEGSDFGAEAQVVVGEDQYSGSELNDPSSPLSNRVVYFDYDSDVVRVEDQATLEAHAAYLSKNPNLTVRLEGHTDERGSREYNLALGERRALSVRQFLMLQGASINQFQVTSFGEERPAEDGHDEYSWSQNRRVEIIYIGR
ncbi:peptidoglycan-associated lipoprotein Pal [Methylophaga sp. OBS4]|uniref:peptidoglycan-associated lipoprotein Pal n=1 Tax=Methylophaga sp. OBS4 TaxID=2991935 RepID=UPI002259A452|nr:peptidoglycan-associated lipoprotein Pal [Methylophaga sp. OBS4]MCX4186338.1 peptidoglycan-associated lipoprotein Pal [Methylophaga sp. OBS4]